MKAEKARRAELVGMALDVLLAKAVELEGSQILPVDGFARQRPLPIT